MSTLRTVVALLEEVLDEVAADEAATAGNENGLLGHGNGIS